MKRNLTDAKHCIAVQINNSVSTLPSLLFECFAGSIMLILQVKVADCMVFLL